MLDCEEPGETEEGLARDQIVLPRYPDTDNSGGFCGITDTRILPENSEPSRAVGHRSLGQQCWDNGHWKVLGTLCLKTHRVNQRQLLTPLLPH